jgi:hypothetical protein
MLCVCTNNNCTNAAFPPLGIPDSSYKCITDCKRSIDVPVMNNRKQPPTENLDKSRDGDYNYQDKDDTNSTDESKTLPLFREPDANKLYLPTLVQMKCRGMLHLSSKKNTFPSCKGIANGLETVREYPPMQPIAAFRSFTQAMNINVDDHHHSSPGFGDTVPQDRNSQGNEKPKEKLNLPLIVDDKWDEMKSSMQQETSLDLNKFGSIRSDMKMYGTSSAYLLVLRPYSEFSQTISKHSDTYTAVDVDNKEDVKPKPQTAADDDANEDRHNDAHIPIPKQSIIYAITPVNEFGVTKRHVNVNNKGDGMTCSSSTTKLGFVEIHMASIGQEDEIDENQNASPRTNRANGIGIEEGKSYTKDTKQQQEQGQPKPSPTAIGLPPSRQQIKDFWIKFNEASNKIQNQMVFNAKFLKNELENDFISRTFVASEKVKLNCEKNLVRMKKNLVDTYNFLADISKD